MYSILENNIIAIMIEFIKLRKKRQVYEDTKISKNKDTHIYEN